MSNADAGIGSINNDVDAPVVKVSGGAICFDNVVAPASLAVYNLTGNLVYVESLATSSGRIHTDLKGFHIVKLESVNGIVSQKIML